jgi:hypothetical protein
MSGSTLAIITIPIAAAVSLAVWLGVVLWHSSRRPDRHGPGREQPQHVAGGTFRGDPRQQMPRGEVPPDGQTPGVSAPTEHQGGG